MDNLIPVRRALISVSDKSGLAPFATTLVREFGAELVSTGGTAQFLRDAGLDVVDVSDVTAFPEMMDGRLKTLHPKVHGGLLAVRDNPQHADAMQTHGIQPIDLLVVNLYPFEKTIAKTDVTLDEAIENIDIGGPAMIRSAAKNHAYVLVVIQPNDYERVLADLRGNGGASTSALRREMAWTAFRRTASYDATIAKFLATAEAAEQEMTPWKPLFLHRRQTLRYGENPHQKAALYVNGGGDAEASVARARQLHGKELSYVNLLDADGALSCVKEFDKPAACIVKHTTPCGCAIADTPAKAFSRAFDGDPLAAFGGIVAFNRPIDLSTAKAIVSIDKLLEVIVAPDFDEDALALLKDRWKNVRLLAVGPLGEPNAGELHMHRIVGGYLVQERDLAGVDQATWKVASQRQPTKDELEDLKFAWLVCKHVKSNAIVICKGGMLLGAGAGQMDRPSAARLAIEKAGPRADGAVAASDAFFPFPDGPKLLLDAGVTAIVHPGGSLKDKETTDLLDSRGAALVLTGQRHFKH